MTEWMRQALERMGLDTVPNPDVTVRRPKPHLRLHYQSHTESLRGTLKFSYAIEVVGAGFRTEYQWSVREAMYCAFWNQFHYTMAGNRRIANTKVF